MCARRGIEISTEWHKTVQFYWNLLLFKTHHAAILVGALFRITENYSKCTKEEEEEREGKKIFKQ